MTTFQKLLQRKILLLETSLPVIERLSKLLENDYHLLVASSAEEASASYRLTFPDLIVANTDLLASTHKSFVEKIRAADGERHTGIIFLAGQNTPTSLASSYLEGGDDFVAINCPQDELMARIQKAVRLKSEADLLRIANYQLKMITKIDDLTGLFNMRGFGEYYASAVARCREKGDGLGLIMIDLDHFKNVNDQTNHLMGSHCLRGIGAVLKSCRFLSANGGLVARYGGDEFIAFCHASGLDEVMSYADEIRLRIANAEFTDGEFKRKLTASLGVAYAPSGYLGSSNDIIKAADAKLYESKNLGRNKVYGLLLGES